MDLLFHNRARTTLAFVNAAFCSDGYHQLVLVHKVDGQSDLNVFFHFLEIKFSGEARKDKEN